MAEGVATKVCTKCQQTLAVDQFYAFMARCKKCHAKPREKQKPGERKRRECGWDRLSAEDKNGIKQSLINGSMRNTAKAYGLKTANLHHWIRRGLIL